MLMKLNLNKMEFKSQMNKSEFYLELQKKDYQKKKCRFQNL